MTAVSERPTMHGTTLGFEANILFQKALEMVIRERGAVGLQVAVSHHGELVVDAWGGIADETTGRKAREP